MFLPQFIISANKNLKYKEFSPLTHRHISPFSNTMCDFFFLQNVALSIGRVLWNIVYV